MRGRVFTAMMSVLAVVLIVGAGGLMIKLAAQSTSAHAEADVPPATRNSPFATTSAIAPSPNSSATSAVQPAEVRVDSAWLDTTAERTSIPRRALQAYVAASLWAAKNSPWCGLQWNSVAAIGLVESDHGRMNGATIEDDGDSSGKQLGPVLDGTSNTRRILDTDNGFFDDDRTFDRAVGPMQFIPQTWKAFGADGNGDKIADPGNIDDAALSAGKYLCSSSAMTTSAGWNRAIRSYNNSDDYVLKVYTEASRIVRIVSPGAEAPARQTLPAAPGAVRGAGRTAPAEQSPTTGSVDGR